MTRALVTFNTQGARERFCAWVMRAPLGWVGEIREPRRTGLQNDRLWASLTDIAAQKEWHGKRLEPADWKILFMAALNKEMRAVPNLDGTGFVDLGQSSSKLTKSEFGDLLDLIYEWGARNGVVFHDPDGDRRDAA
jgi:hypothetical protein